MTRFETPVVREARFWRTVVNRNQNLLGKVFVALRRHEESVAELTSEEWEELRHEVRWVTERLRVAFEPDHFNYAFLQNQDRHVHLHVIPRYREPRRFAGVEFSDPDYPAHYAVPAPENRVTPDVIAEIERALR